jgi:peptidoglycan/LPS O-acetylase OafA/YrhL
LSAAIPIAGGSQRYLELDGLRGASTLLVLAVHALQVKSGYVWATMEMFFVLSGYLIGGFVLRYSKTSTRFHKIFFSRRFLRILPVYLVFLTASASLSAFLQWHGSPPYQVGLAGLLRALTYTQNVELYQTIVPGAWEFDPNTVLFGFGVTWSLAIEEQFYLLTGFLVPLFLNASGRPTPGLVRFLVMIPLVSLVLRAAGMHWWLLPARADGFALGLLLAVFKAYPGAIGEALGLGPSFDKQRLIRAVWFVSGSIFLAIAIYSLLNPLPFPQHQSWGHGASRYTVITSVSVTCVALLWFAAISTLIDQQGHRLFSPLRHPALLYVGKISYSLYLWQMLLMHSVYWQLSKYFGAGELLSYSIGVPITFVVAHYSYRFIEQPWLDRARTLRYEQSREPVEIAVPPAVAIRAAVAD